MIKKKSQKAKLPRRSIYLIGIGGIGMSALARYYKATGCEVSGSDSSDGMIAESLRKDAIKVKIGHKKANLSGDSSIGLVIYNRAIASDNSELVAARALGVRTVPYAEALGELTEEFSTIAITGSHGKSTTTALAGIMLAKNNFDPTVLVGTNLKEFAGKNIRIGKNAESENSWLVLEADDFGAAFLAYSPAISIITNIDREHLDFYKNIAGVKKAFLKFIERTMPGGTLILNRDDKNLYSLKKEISAIAKIKKLRVVWYSTRASGKNTSIKKIKNVLQIPGEHNLSNATAVYELGKLLKIPEKKIIASLGTYQGAWRRMEYRGKFSGTMPIYDDYAHHPTEIQATLQGFREKFPDSPIICVFQPHQAKRLRVLFKEFVASFTTADVLVFIPFYKVAGRDDAKSLFDSKKLAAAIAKKYPHKKVFYLENPAHIKKMLNKIVLLVADVPSPIGTRPPVIVMMGAGDIVQYTDLLIK